MNSLPQSYPLWCLYDEGSEMFIGQVVGWYPDTGGAESDDATDWYPIVAMSGRAEACTGSGAAFSSIDVFSSHGEAEEELKRLQGIRGEMLRRKGQKQ